MAREIKLPGLGQTSDEMSILTWYKNVGDTVSVGEPLLCVETDKAQVDVESAEDGVLLEILASPGEVLSSGVTIAIVGDAAHAQSAHARSTHVDDVANSDRADAPSGPDDDGAGDDFGNAIDVPSDERIIGEPHSSRMIPARSSASRVRAVPAVRKLARERGVDLSTIVGTGPGGIVQRADLDIVPMGASVRTPTGDITSFTLRLDFDARNVAEQIAQLGGNVTELHFLLRSIAAALRDHPFVSRLWLPERQEFQSLSKPLVGVVVIGGNASRVAMIAEPDILALPEVANLTAQAVMRVRSGQPLPGDMAPAAIAVSHLGTFGIDSGDAVIPHGFGGVLAVGRLRSTVTVRGEGLALTPIVSVSLSCDSRAADMESAANFLADVQRHFEHPQTLSSTERIPNG